MKDSEILRQQLKDRFGFRDVAVSSSLAEYEKVNIEARMLNDIHYLAERVNIQDRDIGLNGLSVVINPSQDGMTAYGGFFPASKVISCAYDNGGTELGSFAHEWFHAFDYAMAEEMGLQEKTLTEGAVKGDVPWDMLGQTPFQLKQAERDIIIRSRNAEQWLNENGQATRIGALSGQREISARVFAAATVTEDTKFLGKPVTDQSWAPGGFRIEPTNSELLGIGRTVYGLPGEAAKRGYFEKMAQKREQLPEISIDPRRYTTWPVRNRPQPTAHQNARYQENIPKKGNAADREKEPDLTISKEELEKIMKEDKKRNREKEKQLKAEMEKSEKKYSQYEVTETTPKRDLNENGLEDEWEAFRDENANGISDDAEERENEEEDYTISREELEEIENGNISGPDFDDGLEPDEENREDIEFSDDDIEL